MKVTNKYFKYVLLPICALLLALQSGCSQVNSVIVINFMDRAVNVDLDGYELVHQLAPHSVYINKGEYMGLGISNDVKVTTADGHVIQRKKLKKQDTKKSTENDEIYVIEIK